MKRADFNKLKKGDEIWTISHGLLLGNAEEFEHIFLRQGKFLNETHGQNGHAYARTSFLNGKTNEEHYAILKDSDIHRTPEQALKAEWRKIKRAEKENKKWRLELIAIEAERGMEAKE